MPVIHTIGDERHTPEEWLAFKRDAARWRAMDRALWEPCDCGCPGKARPPSIEAVDALRALHKIGYPFHSECHVREPKP